MNLRGWQETSVVLGLGILLAGCSGEPQTTTSSSKSGVSEASSEPVKTASAAAGYRVMEVENPGHVTGKVRYGGQPPAPKKVEITKDREVCAQKEHFPEDLILSEERGLANVVVSLTDIHEGKAGGAGSGNPKLNQKMCTFIPHVQVVPAGSTVEVYNEDGILHNIHTFSEKNRPVNRAQPKFLKKVEIDFAQPERIRVTCDAHGWMSAWIVVADHPYYAVTDGKGNFRLEGVPPGTYSVEFWHEKLGEATQEVTIQAGGEVSLDHTFSAG